MNRLRSAALTTQGRGLLAGGLTAAACGAYLGERDLLRLGLAIAALPLLAKLWVALANHGLRVQRRLQPQTIEAGSSATVELSIENPGWTLPDVLLQDTHHPALGEPPRMAVRSLGRGSTGPLTHRMIGTTRGVFEVGPLSVLLSDPFGLAQARSQAGPTGRLTVVPTLVDLPATTLLPAWDGVGENRPRSFALGNAADVAVRDYRTGDDLRRVHWRSTARTGDLMVRQEEQPSQSRATLILDDRSRAHRGSRVDSSLEVAISAAGSIAVHLADLGYQVRLVTAGGDLVGGGWHDGQGALNVAVLLQELALLTRSEQAHLNPNWIDDSTSQSLLIGVFGMLHADDLAFLGRLRRRGITNRAVAIDPRPWSSRSSDRPATELLAGEGWLVGTAADRAQLPRAWQELAR